MCDIGKIIINRKQQMLSVQLVELTEIRREDGETLYQWINDA